MATKKTPVNSKLLEVTAATPPANPAITRADLSFLRGLKRRGYTDAEIIGISQKSGLKVSAEQLVVTKRAPKVVAVPPAQARPSLQPQR